MRWWCSSAQGVAWDWTWRPYPGVWLFILIIAFAYWRLRRKLEPDDAGTRKRTVLLFAAGLVSLWLALDWPLGPLGAGYLASIHMIQFLLISLIAPPLILLGLPQGAYAAIQTRPSLDALLRNSTQPVVAFFIFNVVITAAHWPAIVDPLMASQFGSFILDLSWLLAGLIFWWPVVAPVPVWPRFTHLLKLAYLGLNGILIRPPFFILLFSKFPAYATYELAPPTLGTTALRDQQLAAGVMKIGLAWIMVVAMIFVFAAWVRSSREAATTPRPA